jgi:hypothetical protein
MKSSRFAEEQIVGVPREQEDGKKTADIDRKHGIGSAGFHMWKARFGGLEACHVTATRCDPTRHGAVSRRPGCAPRMRILAGTQERR